MKKSDDFQAVVRITASGHDPKSMLMQLKEKLAEEAAAALYWMGGIFLLRQYKTKPPGRFLGHPYE